MLLVHQAGSVKIGEAVRYTLTYTPSNDRILPTPSHLHLKIKNTSTIALRAAWVHGPYALHVSCYPSTFNPHQKVDDPVRHGVPEYEPMLKAGGSWLAKLTVPEEVRETGADLGKARQRQSFDSTGKEKSSVTWIIEVASQILFSTSASVSYEVLVGRDERSLDFGFAAIASQGHGGPGMIEHQERSQPTQRRHSRTSSNIQAAGVYSKAVKLIAEDTETLWNKPALPKREDREHRSPRKVDTTDHSSPPARSSSQEKQKKKKTTEKKKNIHLVILTHGLHSNLGADMLFMKESIDATVRQARIDAKARRQEQRGRRSEPTRPTESSRITDGSRPEGQKHADGDPATAPLSGGQEELDNENDSEQDDQDDEDEETIVRGFPGNAAKTENGIQYLGKRLAKYILRLTYPDQPFLPVKKTFSKQLSDTFKSDTDKAIRDGSPSHPGSSIHLENSAIDEDLPYRFTSISFIGHSLGGLVQTYAIAYIHKHSPTFFQQIEPINFICMASPMLGLSNENPMYVKFALDFGLVGRTGQDLGLTWRPPTIAKGGWNAVIGGLGIGNKEKDSEGRPVDPAAKPLLRILPTGPAHQVLRLFRNRTVYSNVVNDGIVPLRTSCLLFLDWRGLGKVNKARRENGLIGTMAEWGWAELTGANSSSIPPNVIAERFEDSADSDSNEHTDRERGETVPQPDEDETSRDNGMPRHRYSYESGHATASDRASSEPGSNDSAKVPDKGLLGSMIDFFRPKSTDGIRETTYHPSKKTVKAIRRAQTVQHEDTDSDETQTQGSSSKGTTTNPTMRPHLPTLHTHTRQNKRPVASRGDSLTGGEGQVTAPPKTSIFESAGDILHPPLPSRQWITDPSSRTRTIFHDRVYHPEDIPPPPFKQSSSKMSRGSSRSGTRSGTSTTPSTGSHETVDTSGMKVEEKIARAYHRDLSWRKVLVRLQPDAHNNMIVRRMFANAYGWPVVKHLCDTHFADTYTARTRDEDEPAQERAPNMSQPVPSSGEEVANQTARQPPTRSSSEMREARDELTDLDASMDGMSTSHSSNLRPVSRQGSDAWDESIFDASDNDDSDVDERHIVARFLNPHHSTTSPSAPQPPITPKRKAAAAAAVTSTHGFTDGHRGLGPSSPSSPRSPAPAIAPSSQHVAPSFDSADLDRPVIAKTLVTEPQPLGDTDPRRKGHAQP